MLSVPDIGVLGPYTYLATEVMWGAVALALLWYADAFRTAARTVLVLYPFAYVWDWYTLEVGVFEIPLRTGVELLGIPIEEHIFMLVVPAMVVGTHETLRKVLDGESTTPDAPSDDGPRGDSDRGRRKHS
nr:lycopene cyclase domain-containing protein [Halobium salinum]